MTVERNRIGRSFWLRWVLVCIVGWFLGIFIGSYLFNIIIYIEIFRRNALGFILANSIGGAALGSVVGLMQWLILRRRFSWAGWWIFASTVGFAFAGGGGTGAKLAAIGGYREMGYWSGLIVEWAIIMVLGGAVTGILQWLILRSQASRAGWWVLASTVGCGSMVLWEACFGCKFWGEGILPFLLLSVWSGAVLGMVTGGALVWLLRQSVPEV